MCTKPQLWTTSAYVLDDTKRITINKYINKINPHLAWTGVGDLLIDADVQVIAWLISEKEPDGNGLPGWCQTDVDLQFGLQDPELPETAAVAHHHGANRLLNLKAVGKVAAAQ